MGFELDVLFELKFFFEGLKGVVCVAACEGEPLARLLAKARDHFFFRKCSKFAESGDAPERKSFVLIQVEIEGADGDGCEYCGFVVVGNYGEATREFGFDSGSVEVSADGYSGSETGGGDCIAQTMSEFLRWAEETLGTGDVENEGAGVVGKDFFDARRELRECLEKDGSGCGFGFGRPRKDVDIADFFDFEARESGNDAALSGMSVESADTFLRWRSVEDNNGNRLQIGSEAQDGLSGEFCDVYCGVEAVGIHARLAASHAVWAVQVDTGGLRSIEVMGEKRSR